MAKRHIIRSFVKSITPKKLHMPLITTYKVFRNSLNYIRVQKPLTWLLGPKWNRNTEDIEIDITYDCNVKCINCCRSCRQAPSNEMIKVSQIKKFIKESIENDKKWRTIRVLGGEPTMHPNYIEILTLLVEYKNKFSPKTRLETVTNGKLPGVEKILVKVPKEVHIHNTAKETANQLFFEFNQAPKDKLAYKFADFSNGCPTAELCMLLTPYGYYGCSVFVGVDRVIGKDLARKKMPTKNDYMRDQFKELCPHCGFFGYGATTRTTKERLSKSWKKAYEEYKKNPPKLKQY